MFPSPATAGTPVTNYPAAFSNLNLNTPYNLTTTVAPTTAWDSANVHVNGTASSNTSVIAGLYNATYSFTGTAHGAKDPQFTDGTGKYDIQDYSGHDNTFRALMDITGGWNIIATQAYVDQTSTLNVSFWYLTSALTGGGGIAEYFDWTDAGTMGGTAIHIERYENHFDFSCNGVALTRLYTGVSAATWYYISMGINFATKAIVVDLNLARVGTFTASAVMTTVDTFALSAYYNLAYNFYVDALDYSFDPTFSYKRNYNQLLNKTQTFTQSGVYTYQYFTWSSGTRYEYPIIPFTVGGALPASDAPANDSVLYTYSPTAFYKNVTNIGVGNLYLQLMYPNGACRNFTAAATGYGTGSVLLATLAINKTGDFAYRFLNDSTLATPWTTFTITENVQIDSEADYLTRWTFTDKSAGGYTVLNQSSIPTDAWSLTPSSGIASMVPGTIYTADLATWGSSTYGYCYPWQNVAGDSYTNQASPATNYGGDVALLMFYSAGAGTDYRTFMDVDPLPTAGTYLTTNGTDYAVRMYTFAAGHTLLYDWTSAAVDQATITWNNQPGARASAGSETSAAGAYVTHVMQNGLATDVGIRIRDNTGGASLSARSLEMGGTPPQICLRTSKFYAAAGIAYVQSDTNEVITLSSVTGVPLLPGDEIQFNFTTTAGTVSASAGGQVWAPTSGAWRTLTEGATGNSISIAATMTAGENLQLTAVQVRRQPKFMNWTNTLLIRTNVTETLTLTSPNYVLLDLRANDLITINFNTTSTHQINLNLKNYGTIVASYTIVSEGNGNFADQEVVVTITSSLSISAEELTGQFESGKLLYVSSICIERPTFPSYTYDLGPYTKELIALPVINYTLSVIEVASGETVWSRLANVTAGVLCDFNFVPVADGERAILYYDDNAKPLDFSLFWTNITRTLDNTTTKFLSSIDRFYADDGTNVTIETWDRFGNLLNNETNLVENFLSFTLSDVHSIKVQNQMRLPSLITMTLNYSYAQYLAVSEIADYSLFAGTYQLNYTNPELGTNATLSLVVTGPALYTLNSSYHTTFFSCYSYDKLGVPEETVRLFVNATRYAWGPVELLGQWFNVTAMDYLNYTQWTGIVDLSHAAEMIVFVPIATLIITNNQRNESIVVDIREDGILLREQVIAASNVGGFPFRFTNGTYVITCTFANGTVETSTTLIAVGPTDLKTYTLDFGFYQDQVIPDNSPDNWLIIIIAIVAGIGVIAAIAALMTRGKKRRERNNGAR